MTISKTWQRRRRSRRGLTRRHWKPVKTVTWMWLSQLSSIPSFRSHIQIEPSEEIPHSSESITSVDAQKVESDFAARNVTELIVDDGQQADKCRKTRLNDVDGLTRGVRSAGRIERLLRNKGSFGELWNQKGKCLIPCDKQLCSFPTLSEQESGQTRQMDRGGIEVEEERRVRAKRMLVFPTDREKRENESTWRVVASARQKIPASIWRLSRRCHEFPWTVDSLLVVRTWIWSRIQC